MHMAEHRTLYDTFEMHGLWFLPNSEKRVSGTLRYNKGEIYLETMGTIEHQNATDFSLASLAPTKPKNIRVIHGITSIGKSVTLLECFVQQFSIQIPGTSSSRYHALGMIIGKLIEPAKNKFNRLHALYSNFNIWYSKSGIDFNIENPSNFTITHTPVENISVGIPNDLQLQLDLFVRSHIKHYKKTWIEEEQLVIINADRPRLLEELLDAQQCFRYFLMLAMMAPVHPLWYTGSVDGEEVEIYPIQRIYDNIPNITVSDKMMFSFPDISRDFPRIIKSWWSIFEKYHKELLIYFSCIVNEHQMVSELNFQTIAIVLESYYRKKFSEPKMPKKQYDGVIENLLKKVEDDPTQKEFVKRFRKMGNALSLEMMLLKLVGICPETFDNQTTEKTNFCKNLSQTRNYLSHGAEELQDAALEGDELYYLTNQMKILVDGLFLHELQFSSEQINKMMQRNRKTRNYAKEHPIHNL